MRTLFLSILVGFSTLLSAQSLVDAAFTQSDRISFFAKGNTVVKFAFYDNKVLEVSTIQKAFQGVPFQRIDAALDYGNGKIYLFSGEEYVRLDRSTLRMDEGYPKNTADHWKGLGRQKIDATVGWSNGKTYVFRYGVYSRYDQSDASVDAGYPKSINSSTWPGMTYKTIDACIRVAEKTYFFSGGEYIRYDNAKDAADAGYPKSISEWTGLKEALEGKNAPTPESAGINFFQGSWNEALAEAKRTGKPIFLDAYAAWCGPCKWMAKNTFTDAAVGEYFNANFVNLKIDMEKGEGPNLASKFRVRAYPTLVFINANGDVIEKVEGARQASDFVDLGKKVIKKWKNQPSPEDPGEAKGIEFFKGSWKEALAESKRTGKPIFLDAYAVWCGPCKWMARNTFPDHSVGAYYNKHFICMKIDMEKGEGRNLASEFKIRAYPTLLFVSGTGKVLKRVEGSRGPEDFLQLGKSVID